MAKRKQYGPSQRAAMMRGLAAAARMDCVIEKMLKQKLAMTVENYLSLAYLGSVASLDELEGEERVAVDDLIEDGVLVDSNSNK